MDSNQNTEPILNRAITRRDAIKAGGLAAVGLVFTKPIIETLYPRPAFADYTVPDPPPPCPVIDVLDFEVFPANGVMLPLAAGTVITNEFAEWGISVETRRKTAPHYLTPGKPAMIFDSAHPTGGDFDLGTPNEQYPGGVGVSDDDVNNPTLDHGASNDTARGNVLIISEDGDSGDPDDNETGGIILFKFDPPVAISEVGLLDQDDNWETGISGQAMVHNADGWSAEPIICVGGNSWQSVFIGKENIDALAIRFKKAGAVTEIRFFCPDNP